MKKWYRSKTLWVNAIAVVGILVQSITGKEIINAELQGGILAVVNVVLRTVTSEGLE